MSLAPDQVLEGEIRLGEDLGPGRGWLAQDPEGSALRVFALAGPPRPPEEAQRVDGELVATAHGPDWAAVALPGPSLADRIADAGPLDFEAGLDRSLELLDLANALALAGRPPLGLTPGLCVLPEDGPLRIAGQDLALPDECYAGFRPLDQRERWVGTVKAAVYGAGALVHVLLTGEGPRPGVGPSAVHPQVPAWLDRVVQMALDPDPNHRYDSLKTFRAALGAARSAIRLRGREGSKPPAPEVTTTRPTQGCGHDHHGHGHGHHGHHGHDHHHGPGAGGPMSPLGRRRAGGLPPLPAHAVQAGLPDAPVQDRAGMSEHPEAIAPFLPGEADGKPVYRFSWRVTLTRGLPVLLVGGGLLAWAVTWAISLVSP